jgi:3-deoxy-manno-octulosonate cytidylyltransferase (CMP-KDO synthetase)
MRAIAIIPARMGASRFPGKPLHRIAGIPLVGHCYFRTRLVPELAGTYVATCDQEIADYVDSIGGDVVMTMATHNRATDRTAEAMVKIEAATGHSADVVIMVQGDEPLILPQDIGAMLKHFDDPAVDIVNIMSRLKTREQFEDKNNVKAVVNHAMDALYFSREPIPSSWKGIERVPMYMQVGVIAFRRDALIRFNAMPETMLEKIESVDMNRVLETGGRIRMVLADTTTIGVDTLDEADEVSRLLQYDPLFAIYARP